MVMPFRNDVQQLKVLTVGDAVEFEFTDGEMDPRVVTIRKQWPAVQVELRRCACARN